jgi:hypothetical protein
MGCHGNTGSTINEQLIDSKTILNFSIWVFIKQRNDKKNFNQGYRQGT